VKKTKQREIILDIVNDSNEHLNAYSIYEKAKEKLPNISLGTVYRNLNLLTESGQMKKIVVDNEFDRYDKVNEHAHFWCNICEKIYDVYEFHENQIDKINGHLVMNYEIILKGICKKCQEKE